MEKPQPRKKKICRAYISKDAQIKALKERINELEQIVANLKREKVAMQTR